MSKYSGKCDVYDSVIMINNIIDFKKLKIYAYNNEIIPLRIDSQKDLMPYYSFLTSFRSGNKDGDCIIHLSSQSWVDIEEKERLEYKMDDLKRYYRSCKRKKVPFDKDKALKMISFFTPEQYEFELVDRVSEYGEKSTIDNIHTSYHDKMRQSLCDDMIKEGWPKSQATFWCFGFRKDKLDIIKEGEE